MKKTIALSLALTTSLAMFTTAQAATPTTTKAAVAAPSSAATKLENQLKAANSYLKSYSKEEVANVFAKESTKRFVATITAAKTALKKDPANHEGKLGTVLRELENRTLRFTRDMSASQQLTATLKEINAGLKKKSYSKRTTTELKALVKKAEQLLKSDATFYTDLNDVRNQLTEVAHPHKNVAQIVSSKKPALKKQEITAISTHYTFKSVDYGTSFTKLALPKTVWIVLKNKKEVPATVVWNKKEYDPKVVGFQTIEGEVTLPASLKDKVTVPKAMKAKNGKLRAVFLVQVG
ncbi:hypothetical protein A374_15863 [Fictibacillus macauensis ZFHKF-1]|uniref:SbsC C-terminal domain-containing protein n=1 Tax=Fictibacillus macauensis ZFHKF-1 TaxID=1196324 RepID=I8AF67_9BACL|nr:hypothetical protein [Fictibacillus macauensis]EIT84277.1 hypothetical protein A374_15863 [Fictibacillus macauensis ZFHKF-1]